MKDDFKAIFLGLFHGNTGAAEQIAENVPTMNTDYLSDERERIRQDRANYDLAMLKKYCSF